MNARRMWLLLGLVALVALVAAPAPLRAQSCDDCLDDCKKEGKDCKEAAPKRLCKVPGVKGICSMFQNFQCPATEFVCRKTRCGTMPDCDPPPGNPGGRISGDPHLYTLDRARYDLQAVGEFWVASSEEADLQLQARFSPRGTRVSVLSVLAVRSGEHVIVFERDEGITVDGERVEIPADGLYVDAGLLVHRAAGGRYAVLAGTTSVWVWVGASLLDLEVLPDVDTRGQWEGLLGDFDGSVDNDFKVRDGEVIDRDALSAEVLYGQFADSWRLSQDESFLPYGEGETTETFTDRSFPKEHFQVTDLDEEAFEKAQRQCAAAGVRGAEAMRNCIYDLGVTGSEEYAQSYLGSRAVEAALSVSFEGKVAMRVQDSGGQGAELPVFWSGSPDQAAVVSILDADGEKVSSWHRRENPMLVRLPSEVGTYTVRFEQGEKTVSAAVEVVPVQASIDGPATIGGAEVAELSWSGPMREGDQVAFMKAGATTPQAKLEYHWATSGKGSFQVPATPGTYEVWYLLEGAGGRKPIARHSISVGEASASLKAPAQVESGASFPVQWTGPGGEDDFVQIVEPKHEGTGDSIHYAWTKRGKAEVEIRAPLEPGNYELRYVASTVAGRTVLASRGIEVAGASASLAAPETVAGGETFELSWKGPSRQDDFIAFLEAGATSEQEKLGYLWAAKGGGKGTFKAPAKPGKYEIWYVLQGADGRQVLARRPLTVTQGSASLEAPAEVEMGAFFAVQWTGPGGKGDFIQIARPGQKEVSPSIHYAWVKADKREVELRAPLKPGSYQLRYIADTIAGRSSFTSRRIRVVPVTASLEAPREVTAGASFEVSWKAPSRRGDFVSLTKRGEADPDAHIVYDWVRDKSKVTLEAPAEPGSYELRYILQGPGERKILARVPIRVTAP